MASGTQLRGALGSYRQYQRLYANNYPGGRHPFSVPSMLSDKVSQPYGDELDTVGVHSAYLSIWAQFVLDPAAGGTQHVEITPTGGFTFGGAASIAKGFTVSPSGGISLSGAAPVNRSATRVSSGGIQFGGTAPVSSSQPQHREITPSGGFVFGGTAPAVRRVIVNPSGGITFSGTAPYSGIPVGGYEVGPNRYLTPINIRIGL